MARTKKQTSRVDEPLDELLADHQGPEVILGESGLIKQLSKRLIERALAGELSHHLKTEAEASSETDQSNSSASKGGICRFRHQPRGGQNAAGTMDWGS